MYTRHAGDLKIPGRPSELPSQAVGRTQTDVSQVLYPPVDAVIFSGPAPKAYQALLEERKPKVSYPGFMAAGAAATGPAVATVAGLMAHAAHMALLPNLIPAGLGGLALGAALGYTVAACRELPEGVPDPGTRLLESSAAGPVFKAIGLASMALHSLI